MRFVFAAVALLSVGGAAAAQSDFQVTGTPIPASLLRQNYGAIPKGISAFDLNICNVTEDKQALVSSKIYQALAATGLPIDPIGRDIMLAAILRNQSHTLTSILNVTLNSATSIMSLLNVTKSGVPPGVLMGVALGSLTGQQVVNNLKPLISADQLEKFEAQVLEPALVLDGGSCVERTVFVTIPASSNGKARLNTAAEPVSFHIH